MSSFARRNVTRSIAQAALLACALGLAACGGEAPKDPAAAAAPGQPGAPTTAAGQARPVGPGGTQTATAVTAGPLDTTTWVLKPPFYAAGDEPAWRLDIDDGWFSFKRPGLPVIEEPMVQPKSAGGADVFEAGSLHVVIKREACETDNGGKGDFSTVISFDSTDFDGCAFSGSGVDADSTSPEAKAVIEALAPIDACLAKLGEPALVTAIYPREDGELVGVALRAKNGGVYDCGAKAAGANVEYLDQMEQGSQPAWMSRMRFLRDGVKTTAPACADAKEVKSGDKVVGRLLTKACKF